MATAPIPPGGIVSVPDPITGGAGAPVIVSQIVNAKWANAVQLLNAASERVDAAVLVAETPPQMESPELDKTYKPVDRPDIPEMDPNDAQAVYDAANKDIGTKIENDFFGFLRTYFPDTGYFTAALAWINKALTTGGTGINAAVEAQVFERARARLGIERARAEGDAFSAFAGRGFELPPGALVHSLNLIGQDMRDKLAEQSRDISIEAFRAELENTRFAVGQAVDLRMRAVAAAGDYIKTLILGPQTAMELAKTTVGLRTEMARSMVALYTAENAALEPRVRLAITDATIKQQGAEANLRANSMAMQDRINAGMENARTISSAAAASLNGINASAGITNGASPDQ